MKKLFFFIAVVAGLALCGQESAAQKNARQNWDMPSLEGNKVTVRHQVDNPKSKTTSTSGYIPKGYRGMAEVALGANFDGPYFVSKQSTIHGYQFNQYVFLGGMLGTTTGGDYFAAHLAADARFYFTKTRVAPYALVRAGIALHDYYCYYSCGFFSNVGIGARYALKKKLALTASIQLLGTMDLGVELVGCIGFEF